MYVINKWINCKCIHREEHKSKIHTTNFDCKNGVFWLVIILNKYSKWMMNSAITLVYKLSYRYTYVWKDYWLRESVPAFFWSWFPCHIKLWKPLLEDLCNKVVFVFCFIVPGNKRKLQWKKQLATFNLFYYVKAKNFSKRNIFTISDITKLERCEKTPVNFFTILLIQWRWAYTVSISLLYM